MTPVSRHPLIQDRARSDALRRDDRRWRSFTAAWAVTAAACALALYAFVAALDPYGLRAGPGRAPTPIMDLNQRYMYPQLVRSGLFDGAILGTSTIRLIDPEALGGAVGQRLVNLGLNAGTPWEQVELASLFLRHVPRPALMVFGLDRTWCDPAADAEDKRLTFRSFPPWLYDESRLNDLPGLASLKSLEIAGRVALYRLGLMPERIRRDGYEVFTPPESGYDLARARLHIWSGTGGRVQAHEPAVALSAAERSGLTFPALAWLSGLMDRLPAETRVVLLLPPIHVAAQAEPGSRAAAEDEACKARIAAIGLRPGATTLDFRFASDLTADDANYWDKLHYRQPVAARLVTALRSILSGGGEPLDASYRLLSQ